MTGNNHTAAANEPRPQRTQDEAIAFECARECITHLIGIITDELHNRTPNEARIAALEAERSSLFREQQNLYKATLADVARINTKYGAFVRAHMAWEDRDTRPRVDLAALAVLRTTAST